MFGLGNLVIRAFPCLLLLFSFEGLVITATAGQVNSGEKFSALPSEQRRAESYYQFVLGRHLEGEDQFVAALDAYQRAVDLNPGSTEVLAELAGFYVRQNRSAEALEAGEAVLRLDPDNVDAHRVLATVFSALVDGVKKESGQMSGARKNYLDRAIQHIERARVDGSYNRRLEFTLGRFYIRSENYGKAIEVLSRFVERTSGQSEGVLLLARAQAAVGRMNEAIQTLKSASEKTPGFYRALSELAGFYEDLERWDEAAEAYAAAIEQNPGEVEFRRRYAGALMSAGRNVEARDTLRTVVSSHPDDMLMLYLLAQVERRLGDLDASEATARRLMKIDPSDLRGIHALVQVYQRRRQFHNVVEILVPLLESDTMPGSPLSLRRALQIQLGFTYLQLDQHDFAIGVFERMYKSEPSDPTIAVYLVRAHIAANRYSEAILLTRLVRKLHSSDLRLVLLEAEALHADGQRDSAVLLLEKSVVLYADVPEAYVALAVLYADSDRSREALRLLEDAKTKFPGSVEVSFQQGAILEQQRRYSEAEEAFLEVLDLDSKHALTLNYLGYMLVERGERLKRAVEYIQRALTVDPENSAFVDSLGWAYFKLDKLALAETHLLRAASRLSKNSVVQDHVGELFFKLGRYEDAIAAWKRSLAGDGESIKRVEIEKKIDRAYKAIQQNREH
jgi:tetratricopeptide (TPR) repeat protein